MRLWDAVKGVHKRVLTGHTGPVESVAFSPDGRTLANGIRNKAVWLWDTMTWKHKRTLTGYTDDFESIVFSPDGKMLASGGADGMVQLWDAVTWKHKQDAHRNTGFSIATAFAVHLWQVPLRAEAGVGLEDREEDSATVGYQNR